MTKAGNEAGAVRLDRWLWAARFFKTRQLAVAAIKAGHVTLNGNRAKPARVVREGDELQIHRGQEEFAIAVTGLAEKRLGAALAQKLYLESEESRRRREEVRERLRAEVRAVRHERGRPSKRDRRQLERLKRGSA